MTTDVEFGADVAAASAVMSEAASWMTQTEKRAWSLDAVTPAALTRFASPGDIWVGYVGGQPAIAAVLTADSVGDDWRLVDDLHRRSALHIHWLAVSREFAGRGLPAQLVGFAARQAQVVGVDRLRLVVDGDEPALHKLYRELGFELVTIVQDEVASKALYERLLANDGASETSVDG